VLASGELLARFATAIRPAWTALTRRGVGRRAEGDGYFGIKASGSIRGGLVLRPASFAC
jgi:hypothetical protein